MTASSPTVEPDSPTPLDAANADKGASAQATTANDSESTSETKALDRLSTHYALTKEAKILIVDDEPYNVAVVKKYLEDEGYSKFVTTTDSTKALTLICRENPDVILLDIVMPEITGIDILRSLVADQKLQRIPVLILTASTKAVIKQLALELGAIDFLAKPVDPHDLIPRVRNALRTKLYQDRLTEHAEELDQLVWERTRALEESRKQLILCLARAGEYRDDQTGKHVVRVGKYVAIIARALGYSDAEVEDLELAAQLHDIGKIGVPDAILHHPGKLETEDFARMQKHCAIGKVIIQPLPDRDLAVLRNHAQLGGSLLSPSSSPILALASRIAQTHHERWDGTGYPMGLAGEDIPIEGRMTAVADVYDALSSKRPYKPAFPRQKCFDILIEGRGSHFDPAVVDAFLDCSEEVIQVQIDYMDCD